MAAKKLPPTARLQNRLVRLCRVHFVLVAVYAVYVAASDATNLIAPAAVLQRFTMAAVLLTGTSIVWYLARYKRDDGYYRKLIYLIIALDICWAAFTIYTQRGMASRGVMLFSLPIVGSTMLLSRRAIFVTACLSTAAYVLSALKYFVDYFNEGYRAELYIEVGFYCAVFFVLSGLLSILVSSENLSDN